MLSRKVLTTARNASSRADSAPKLSGNLTTMQLRRDAKARKVRQLEERELKDLFAAGAISRVVVAQTDGGWMVVVRQHLDPDDWVLAKARGGVRVVSSFDSLLGYLQRIGMTQSNVIVALSSATTPLSKIAIN